MTTKQKIVEIKSFLDKLYPTTETFLKASNDFQFLVCVILSAQAQDKVVNKVTPKLFEKYISIKDLSLANYEDVLKIIYLVGLGPSKAKNIINLAKKLVLDYQCKVPYDLKELETLPGVGHKTATVFLAEKNNGKYIPVDTHIFRICTRLGIVKKDSTPLKLQSVLEKNYTGVDYINFHRQLILFGRNICLANKKRKCQLCPFSFCKDRIETY